MDDRPISFAVEVKFKRIFYNDKLILCKDWQMKRYKDFGIAFNMPVFILHGVGGTPYNPKDLYIIPLTDDISHVLSIKQVEQYRTISNI